MRLGGPIFREFKDPDSWIRAAKASGYSACYCPVVNDAGDDVIRAYAKAAKKADIIIAEVGAWSNPISPDGETRKKAVEFCKKQLELAEKIGANCCVNISGARGEKWDGPHPDNLSESTFDLIVETVRNIIDAVKPKRTFYTLETMPWVFPDSPDNYLRLIKAIDRKQFAVHLDPVNLVCSPQRYFANGELIKECFKKLGKYIKSCHAKDIILRESMTTHLDETRPGTGGLDYRIYLRELNKLDANIPLMLEHLPDEKEYVTAGEYIRKLAKEEGVVIL
jgi:sugar phosphate isomerase/epimerase